MTVKELIDALKRFPKDKEILLSGDAEGNRFYSVSEVEYFDMDKGKKNPLVIWPDHSEINLFDKE